MSKRILGGAERHWEVKYLERKSGAASMNYHEQHAEAPVVDSARTAMGYISGKTTPLTLSTAECRATIRGLMGEMMAKRILMMLGVCCLVLGALPRIASAEDAESAPPEVVDDTEVGEESDPVAERSITSPDDRDAGRYAVRLRDLETRISMLQEQIYRSKARLSLLAESVISGVIAGSKAVVVHRNEMGNSYRLVRAVFALDGAPIFSRTGDDGEELDDSEEIELFNGSIVPGEHTLSVSLEYRGHGYGIFLISKDTHSRSGRVTHSQQPRGR